MSAAKHVLAICGSLRASSSNRSLLLAAQRLAPPELTVTMYDRLGDLPHFNADLDPSTLPVVVELSASMKACDALILSSPEYAFGVPGSLKNAFDWLVGGDAFVYKPFVLLSASARATTSRAAWVKTLTAMSGRMIEEASITIPLLGTSLTADEIVAHTGHGPALRRAMRRLADVLANELPEAR